ncbi:MAG: DUF6516 family protein [bacterium]
MVDCERVLYNYQLFDDGTLMEVEIYRVEDPEQFPSGFKYSFQFCDPESGETYLRYDNSHSYEGHPDRHHRHKGETVSPLKYPGDIYELYKRFKRKVEVLRGS